MVQQISTIAWITFKEALYSRLLLICLLSMLVLAGVAAFLGDVIVAGAGQLQAGLMGWGARWLGVLTLSVFCAGSTARDASDKVIELLIAMPIRREWIYLGKLSGLFLLAAGIAVIAFLVSSLYAPYWVVALWAISLWLEFCVVASFTLWVVTSTGSYVGSVVMTLGFYVLARAMLGIIMMASGPFFEPDSTYDHFIVILVDVLSWILPPLYEFASTDWLIEATINTGLASQFGYSLIYVVLLASVAMIELHRRQF